MARTTGYDRRWVSSRPRHSCGDDGDARPSRREQAAGGASMEQSRGGDGDEAETRRSEQRPTVLRRYAAEFLAPASRNARLTAARGRNSVFVREAGRLCRVARNARGSRARSQPSLLRVRRDAIFVVSQPSDIACATR